MSIKTIKCKFCGESITRDTDNYVEYPEFCNYRCFEYFQLQVIFNSGSKDEGFKHERTQHNDREKAFSEHWKKENKVRPGLNYGNGTLQDLLIEPKHDDNHAPQMILFVEPRDRFVAATVIQWLGSNVGQCFLDEVLKDFGKKIVDINK